MTYAREIKGESLANDQKLFSIYERHTDIIVKGGRDIKFGHKVNTRHWQEQSYFELSDTKGQSC